jgi:hypothetical protein
MTTYRSETERDCMTMLSACNQMKHVPKLGRFKIPTHAEKELRGRAGSTADSHLEGTGFKSRPGNRLPLLKTSCHFVSFSTFLNSTSN